MCLRAARELEEPPEVVRGGSAGGAVDAEVDEIDPDLLGRRGGPINPRGVTGMVDEGTEEGAPAPPTLWAEEGGDVEEADEEAGSLLPC